MPYPVLESAITLTAFIASMLLTLMFVNHSKPKATDVSLWTFITTYLLMCSVLFLLISTTELIEFLVDFGIITLSFNQTEIYLFLIIPASFAIHVYAIYRLLHIVEFNVENMNPNNVGLPFIYATIFFLISKEIPEFGKVAYDIATASEFVYMLSLPIVLSILYLTIREKKIEDAIIQLPIESLDKLSGISLSMALFSIAVFMNVHGYHLIYDLLEAFALIVFAVSGELYRRSLFKMRKML